MPAINKHGGKTGEHRRRQVQIMNTKGGNRKIGWRGEEGEDGRHQGQEHEGKSSD